MNLPDDRDEPRLELTYNVRREEPCEIGTGYGHIADHDLGSRSAALGSERAGIQAA